MIKLILKIGILYLIVAAVLRSCGFSPVSSKMVDQLAPDFALESLSGEIANLAQLRDGKPCIIFFWATWCPHCHRQLNVLAQEQDVMNGYGAKLIIVNVGESREEVRRYVSSNNIPFEVFLDETEEVSRDYKVMGIPSFFFIDREGIIVDVKNFLPKQYDKILGGFAS